ncbi:MAG: VWA domain-containing protein [Alphaproteobacteria bacterium]
MSDKELEKLKSLPVPPASAGAKAAALSAAMAAFDAASENAPESAPVAPAESAPDTEAEKNPRVPQENADVVRLTHASQSKRRLPMRVRHGIYAIAASIAVVAVGLGTGVYYTSDLGVEDRAASEPVAGTLSQQPAPVNSAEKPASSAQPSKTTPSVASPSNHRTPIGKAPAKFGQKEIHDHLGGNAKMGSPAESEADDAAAMAPAAQPPAPSGRLALKQKAGNKRAYMRKRVDGYGAFHQNGRLNDNTVLPQPPRENRDKFEATKINPVKQVSAEPVSTFSIDVDTASYSFVRRALNAGRMPQKNAVRVEEMINYFPYEYPVPEKPETPFKANVTVTPSPWNPANKLLHIGIKGYELQSKERPRANLVFLIDVSGSMRGGDRLGVLKNAFRMLVNELKPDDTVGIVVYAGSSGVALEPTKVANKGKIIAAIDRLGAGGSTAGAEGINDAYRLAEANFDKEGVNRVILATDGDFNVGITNREELKGFIERKRKTGIFLSILGVGRGNYNDALMQKLAQNGNGTAAYVDTLNEARKVLVDEASSTLFPIAKDVKIQVEFNPETVSEYRLIGYETRALKREDFNNDKVDAGDIGSGHTVTAIYEFTPKGAPKLIDDLRYSGREAEMGEDKSGESDDAAKPEDDKSTNEYAFLKVRYKLPTQDKSTLVTTPVTKAMEFGQMKAAPQEVRFSVAVAAFGQLLRGTPYLKDYSYDDVIALAKSARGDDPFGYRAEFLNLVRLAKSARP